MWKFLSSLMTFRKEALGNKLGKAAQDYLGQGKAEGVDAI